MKTSLFLSVLLATVFCGLSATEVSSPEGFLSVRLTLEEGALHYDVKYKDKVVLEESPLGLETSLGSFSTGLNHVETKKRSIDELYTLPHGKTREVRYKANEMTSRFTNETGNSLEVIFRVSDNDVAFAYRLSSPEQQRVIIEQERTGFNFSNTTTAFLSHQAKAGTGWKATKPSYEEGYLMDVPVSAQSPTGLGFTFPGLFRLGDDGWALLSETGVSSRYVGSKLSNPSSDGLYAITFPEADENGGVGDATVSASLPLLTPWRTLTVGSTLAPIVETTISTDVVEPLYEASVAYQSGRATWSWLIWQDASMNEADQRTFIDLASSMGYEFILIDALWDANIGRERMAGLVAYARSKNVGVLLWYNSNGSWNDAPQSPRDIMDSAPARQKEMAWLQSIGVKGMKVDFFGGDKQVTMKLYEDILTDANIYGLMLNFHGATLPRGWERMYPNHMTSEAVTASENLVFSQGFSDSEAWRSTVISFVRNPVAAMDYGPMVLNHRLSRNQDSGTIRRTTDAFQLATTVLFQSPLQHFGLTPNNLEEQPDFVIDFLRKVPAVWDETRYVEGYPGKYVVLARRSGEDWYLVATNGGERERTLSLTVPYLAGKRYTLIQDKPGELSARSQTIEVEGDGRVEITLEANGGAVLYR